MENATQTGPRFTEKTFIWVDELKVSDADLKSNEFPILTRHWGDLDRSTGGQTDEQ